MRLSIDHVTRYRFSEPQARLVQMLRITPLDTDSQTIASWRIDVDCDARLKPGCDGFGNQTTMLYVDGPVEGITVTVRGDVLTSASDGAVAGASEPLPPPMFLRTTALTKADDAIRALLPSDESDGRSTVAQLCRTISERFAADKGRPEPGLPATEAVTRDRATPRDLAHILIAAARAAEIPARYVSGYALLTRDGQSRPTPHAWVEACVGDAGWIGFDPGTGQTTDDHYVRVAVGLDAASVPPVTGSRMGPGDEELDVDVSVERVSGEE